MAETVNPPNTHTANAQAPTVTVVRSIAELSNFEGSWDSLSSLADCTIFQTYDWNVARWKYFGGGTCLYCLIVKRGEAVVGIAPLQIENSTLLGVRVASVVKFIFGDYINLIAAPEDFEVVLAAVLDHLINNAPAWDIFEVNEINERYPLLKLLPEYLRERGMKHSLYRGNIFSRVQLPASWEEFLQQSGGKFRHELKRKTDRMSEKFNVDVELITDGDKEVREAVESFAEIHGKRWRSLGYKSQFDNQTFRDFHVEVSQRLARKGSLRMLFYRVNGERAAASYNFIMGTTLYAYHANAFASDEVMKYSPGFLLHCSAIRRAIDEGALVYDMLRGNESYKYVDFNCASSFNWQVRGISPSRAADIRYRLFTIIEFFSKVSSRLSAEFHSFKRFYVTRHPSPMTAVKRVLSQMKGMVGLAGYFVKRSEGNS